MIRLERRYILPKKYTSWKYLKNRAIKIARQVEEHEYPVELILGRKKQPALRKGQGWAVDGLVKMEWSNPKTPVGDQPVWKSVDLQELLLEHGADAILNNELLAVSVWRNLDSAYDFYNEDKMIEMFARFRNDGFIIMDAEIIDIPDL
jgi:hypothetical protein